MNPFRSQMLTPDSETCYQIRHGQRLETDPRSRYIGIGKSADATIYLLPTLAVDVWGLR